MRTIFWLAGTRRSLLLLWRQEPEENTEKN
jgi:hypothetical protein